MSNTWSVAEFIKIAASNEPLVDAAEPVCSQRTRDYVVAKVDVYRKRLCWDEFMKKAGMTTFEYY